MMRKFMVVIILVLLVFLLLIPSEVRAALINRNNPIFFQQVATIYPNGESTSTNTFETAYPINTVSFGTSVQTPTFTPTQTQITGFVTATSSYANTAAAMRTSSALTLEAATRNSPLYTPGTPSPSPIQSETPTTTSPSMPSWTPSPSFTSFPTVITTPRVLERGVESSAVNLQTLLIALTALGLTCFLIVGFWYFRKKR